MLILAFESTAYDFHDCDVFETLIDSIPNQIDKALSDGAYGTVGAYKKCNERNIELITLPRSSDVVYEKATDQHILDRNKHVGYFQINRIYAWANKNDYWQRNRAETTMSRYVLHLLTTNL